MNNDNVGGAAAGHDRLLVGWVLVLAGLLVLPGQEAFADTAFVLPKGISRMDLKYQDYFDIDERFNPDGDKEDVAVDFNTALNSNVFPALRLVEGALGLPAGFASLGDSEVDLEYDIKILEMQFAYGLSDKVSLGIKIPYWWVKTKVSAEVNSSPGSSATVGFNPLFGTPGDPIGAPVAPLAVGAAPATTEDVQQILGPGLAINGAPAVPGFGYKRFGTWEGNGFADIEAGARYQYKKSKRWRHAFTGALRFPTGRDDDPDDLVDFRFGQGAYALLFRSNHDYIGLENWLFNVTLKYDLVLPHSEVRRVPADPNLPITQNKEDVDIDVGDRIELDLLAQYKFTPEWSMAGRYRYAKKWEDDVDGNMGFSYSALEEESDRTGNIYQIYLAYSTVEKYRNKQARFPVDAAISYRDRFAGSNNALHSQYVELRFRLYF